LKTFMKIVKVLLLIIILVIAVLFWFLHHTFQSKPWPESLQTKQAILKHCADVLELSMDTNQLAMIADKLASQPAILKFGHQTGPSSPMTFTFATNADVIFAFENFSQQTISNLNEFARHLTDSNIQTLVTFKGNRMAFVPNPHNSMMGFDYCISRNTNFFVQQIDEFPNSTSVQRTLQSSANFYENGKLRWYQMYKNKSRPQIISFNEDGKFDRCDLWADGMQVWFSLDETGVFMIRNP